MFKKSLKNKFLEFIFKPKENQIYSKPDLIFLYQKKKTSFSRKFSDMILKIRKKEFSFKINIQTHKLSYAEEDVYLFFSFKKDKF